MKKLIFILLFIFISSSIIIAQTGWFQQQSGIQYSLRDVYFVNPLTGWAVGDSGKIIKTSNGGSNWISQNSNTSYDLKSVKFFNELTGWVVGGILVPGTPYSYEYGVILRTTDGGNLWNNVTTVSNGLIINDVYLIDPNNLYIAIGGNDWNLGFSSGNVSKTTNSGINWLYCFGGSDVNNAFKSVFFIDQYTGWASAIYTTDVLPGIKSKIFKTTNQGVNWNVTTLDSGYIMSVYEYQKIRFLDVNTGYSIQRYLKKTTNSGSNWYAIDSSHTSGGKTYHFINQDTGWLASSTGSILRTNNGGQNWNSQFTPITGFFGIYFVNQFTGWIVGNNGNICKTTDGGISVLLDTTSAKYIPLAVGNVYKFHFSSSAGFSYDHKYRIIKDTIIDSKKYYVMNGSSSGLYRYDSLTGNYYNRSNSGYCSYSPFEVLIDSLASNKGDSAVTCTSPAKHICTDTSNITLFGLSVKRKTFTQYGMEGSQSVTYCRGFGISNYSTQDIGGFSADFLIGCYINGVLYGDTSNVNYSISGTVRYTDNNQPVTSGVVKAIKLNQNDASIIIYDTAIIQSNGTYILQNVPQDSIYIGLYPNSGTTQDYLISYYPAATDWHQATGLYPTSNLTNIDLGAIRIQNATANNSVNGRVMRLTNSITGNLKDAVLYAKNGNTFVRCSTSDVNGVYHLPSLPTGNLKIIVNRLGFSNDSTTVNVTSSSNIDSINFNLFSNYTGIKPITGVVPPDFKLYQNYPNPFNPVTKIKFDVAAHSVGQTFLSVYDLLGREIQTLVNEKLNPGTYEVTFDGSSYASGVYFYQLRTGDFVETKKMLMIK